MSLLKREREKEKRHRGRESERLEVSPFSTTCWPENAVAVHILITSRPRDTTTQDNVFFRLP